MTISPAVKAYVSLAITTFIGAVIGYLAPMLSDGVPPESKLKSMVIGAVVVGITATWHRFAPSPVALPIAPTMAMRDRIRSDGGFVRIEAMMAIAFTSCGVFIITMIVACNPANTIADVDASACILKTAVLDADQGMTPQQIILDVSQRCGQDVATVVTTLDRADKAATATRAARVGK